MSTRAVVWSTVASVGTHLVGLAAAPGLFVALAPVTAPVPIEVVRVPVPIPQPAVPTPSRPNRELAVERRTTASRAADARRPRLLETAPTAPSLASPPAPVTPPTGAPAATGRSPLPEPAPAGAGSLLLEPGSPGAGAPSLLAERNDASGALATAPAGRGTAGAGANPGALGSAIGRVTGHDTAGMVVPGAIGTLAVPAGPQGAEGPITAFVRPLGGYQLTPPYPESARRQGAQGTTRLRFEVLATGGVGRVVVDQSAGHPDLDRAAIEAVRQWRFEPARRGVEPVTVWVTLPVRFELR